MKRLGKLSAVVLAMGLLAHCPEAGAVDPPPRWKTGVAFQRALTSRFEVVDWPDGSRLRDRLQRLSQWQEVAVFLDREIDPGQSIKFSGRHITLAELLDQLAAQSGGMTMRIGSVIYIGPRNKVAGLSRIAQQRARETRAQPGSSRLTVPRNWKWDALSEPRVLLAQLAEEAGVVMTGIEEIPHDLWPQADLPALSWADRLTIVLAGFGRTFQWVPGEKAVQLIPLPAPELATRSYPATLSQVSLEQITAQFPDVEIQRSPDGITFNGTMEEHDRLRKLLARQSKTKRSPGIRTQEVHSLRVNQQPVGAILKTLERQLHLRLEYQSGVREKLITRVSFDLRDVPLEKLLDATLAPASLTYRRDGDVIRIGTKE